jgi:hypothetical protein
MVDDQEARRIAEPILRRALEPLGLAELQIVPSLDHDGDPILLAIAKYRPDSPKFSARVQLDAVVEAMAALADNGDERFLHVRNEFADGEPVADDFSAARRPKRRATAKR